MAQTLPGESVIASPPAALDGPGCGWGCDCGWNQQSCAPAGPKSAAACTKVLPLSARQTVGRGEDKIAGAQLQHRRRARVILPERPGNRRS
ncbi:MAG: hypothetical protein U0R18_05415 [Mycobacterium sp.]